MRSFRESNCVEDEINREIERFCSRDQGQGQARVRVRPGLGLGLLVREGGG